MLAAGVLVLAQRRGEAVTVDQHPMDTVLGGGAPWWAVLMGVGEAHDATHGGLRLIADHQGLGNRGAVNVQKALAALAPGEAIEEAERLDQGVDPQCSGAAVCIEEQAVVAQRWHRRFLGARAAEHAEQRVGCLPRRRRQRLEAQRP